MARNPPYGDGNRRGFVSGRAQVYNDKTGLWTNGTREQVGSSIRSPMVNYLRASERRRTELSKATNKEVAQ
jgi:hypothetical protein